MAENRVPDERYGRIARELVASEETLAHIAASGVRIAYLSSDAKRRSKGRAVLATCELVPARYRWAMPYDFTVTVFEPNVVGMSEDQLRVLMLHELYHVGVEMADGGNRYSIVGHDIEDFNAVIDRYGAGWAGVSGGGA